MVDASAPAVAASQASVNTVLQTVESATEVLQQVMPEIAMVGGFVPGATPFIQLVGLGLPIFQNAIKLIMEEEGKDAVTAFTDVIKHLSKGMPNSPTLSSPSTGN